MVILGFMNAMLSLVSTEALEKAISKNVPMGTAEFNLNAMREGIELAKGQGS